MRLIDADKLYKQVQTECNPYGKPSINYEDGNKVMEWIENSPTIESERTTGEWIDDGDPATWVCECCGYRVFRYNNTPFCPNCGAKME